MKKITLILVLISTCLFSQTDNSKNNYVFLEGLGSVGYYSVNFDKTLYKSDNFRDFIRVGLCVVQDSWTKGLFPNKPQSFYMQYSTALMIGTENGTKKWRRELSVGMLLVTGEPVRQYNIVAKYGDANVDVGITSAIGLRYYFDKVPLFLRFAYTPMYAFRQKTFVPIMGGVSVGYKF